MRVTDTAFSSTLATQLKIAKMTSHRFNVGVIGYGLSAKVFHIPFINDVDDFHLYAVVQRNPQPNDHAKKDHPGIQLYHSTEDLVNDTNVDVVVVTTPPETHFKLASLALKAHKHVLVEKPFTPSSAEAQELVKLARDHQVLLTVYQNRRFDADFLTLRKCIEDGKLGRIAEFETHFDRHEPDVPPADRWQFESRPGVSVVYNLGTHLMDQVVHLFGQPEKITGFVGRQRGDAQSGPPDSCTILLHYSDGLLATIKASVITPEIDQLRFWVRGTQGSFKKFHLDPQEDQLLEGMKLSDDGYGRDPASKFAVLNISEAGEIRSEALPTVDPVTYSEFYRRFGLALKGDIRQLPVSTQEAVSLIKLVELAHRSSEQGMTLRIE